MQPHTHYRGTTAAILILSAAGLAMTGCTIDSHKQGTGDNVKIATPFGGMSIKTDENAVEAQTGLPAYPGAQIAKKTDGNDHNSGAADINMSFGSFQLRVKAVSYTTPDSPDKVLAFYRKGLARYGTIIQCSGHEPVGTPTRTPDGLDCSDNNGHGKTNYKVNEDFSGKTELKAGSKQHQHIVSVDPQGGGTKFGLVALDLPGHIFSDDKDSDKGERTE